MKYSAVKENKEDKVIEGEVLFYRVIHRRSRYPTVYLLYTMIWGGQRFLKKHKLLFLFLF